GDAQAVGAMVAEVGEVDGPPDDRGRPRYAPAGAEPPADIAGARVERVEAAVVRADVDRRPEARGIGDGGRGVDVSAGLNGPVEPPVAGVVGVHAAVGVAQEDAPVDDGGGRVEGAAAEQGAAGAALPNPPPGPLGHGLYLPGVVAEVEHAAGQRGAGLDGAVGVVGPQQV